MVVDTFDYKVFVPMVVLLVRTEGLMIHDLLKVETTNK